MKTIVQRGLAAALILAAGGAAAQDVQAPPEDVITVHGDLPHCRQRPGDPLDAIKVSGAGLRQSVIEPDTDGRLALAPDDNPVTGPDQWQRAGRALADYIYRVPTDGNPLCIGGSARFPGGFAQLRRILDPKPYYGKYARFTAFVATRKSDEVRFWLAVGDSDRIYQGGDTSRTPLTGSHLGWTPVSMTIGPIQEYTTKLSYGFLLMGRGDVWVLQPKLEILDRPTPDPNTLPLTRLRN